MTFLTNTHHIAELGKRRSISERTVFETTVPQIQESIRTPSIIGAVKISMGFGQATLPSHEG
jgi:hypothetical protein